mgnify:CR=1 FL=1
MVKLVPVKGEKVPEIGLGTYLITPDAFSEAIKIGYRIIDTSDDYDNETMIGDQLTKLYNENIVSREDLFIQTKISDNQSSWANPLCGVYFWNNSPFMQRHAVEEVMKEKIHNSKKRLRTDYLDSVLLHFPYPDYFIEMWDVLCKIKNEENIRYIGVSNFSERHISSLSKNSSKPQINQTYFSPIGNRQSLCDYCNNEDIKLMTYSPLQDLHSGRLNMSIINSLANKYGKDPSQIVLRWNIERGSIPCPKSNHPARLLSNFESIYFNMDNDDMNLISSQNYDYQYIPESKYCPGI